MAEFRVVVCGGGIAGIEALLRLRRLAGEQAWMTVIEPRDELVYRPLAVREPFALAGVRRYPLERIAADTRANWEKDRLASVDREGRRVHTDGGRQLPYDALLLALGARESAPFKHAHVFTDRNADDAFHGIVHDIEQGYLRSIAFVLPQVPIWPLPLYELALMTAERAHSLNVEPKIMFVTPEARPLKAFGETAAEAIVALFESTRIELHTGAVASVPAAGHIEIDGSSLHAQRIVTIPRIRGHAIHGIPAGTDWFVPVDEHCVVQDGDGREFAAGDVSDFPFKHGGIGAQQADTAAAGIAHLAGLGERPPPVRPIIRGMLLTGGRPLYLSAQLVAGLGWRSAIYERPPWPADEKVIAEELGPYLRKLDAAIAT
jgi:sulfide:quinone oxidoreductase